MTPENKVKKKIKEAVEARGGFYYAIVETGFGNRFVDGIACLRGRFIAIEAKAGAKPPTPRQLFNLRQCKKAQGLTAIVHGLEAIPQFEAWLDHLCKEFSSEEITDN